MLDLVRKLKGSQTLPNITHQPLVGRVASFLPPTQPVSTSSSATSCHGHSRCHTPACALGPSAHSPNVTLEPCEKEKDHYKNNEFREGKARGIKTTRSSGVRFAMSCISQGLVPLRRILRFGERLSVARCPGFSHKTLI